MYAVIVELEIKSGHMDDFMALLKENAETSLRDEVGCAQFDICLPDGSGQANYVWLYELYDDAKAFQAHLDSEHFKTFDEAAAEMLSDKRVITASRRYPD